MTEQDSKPFLYVVVCAAGIAAGVSRLITAAQERDWEIGVFATPVAMGGFFDTAAVEAQTGRPIRSAWRTPGDPRPFPPPDAVLVAPATFNTINKWAAGTADTLALSARCARRTAWASRPPYSLVWARRWPPIPPTGRAWYDSARWA